MSARELELKFELGPGSLGTVRSHSLLADESSGARRTVSVYYDTKRALLRKAGLTLRVRSSGKLFIQTVKAARIASAGLFDRAEWETPITGTEPDLAAIAGTPLEAVLRHAARRKALRPVFETIVDRESWTILHEGAEIEVILDEGEVQAEGQRQPLVELELELKRGEPGALFALARIFHGALPIRLGVLSKSEQGFRLAAGKAVRAVKAEPVAVDATMRAAEGIQAVAYACIRQFRLNEQLLLVSREPAPLHQARVALRRLRAALSLFKPVLEGEQLAHFKGELRWLSQALGQARDLDVFISTHGKTWSEADQRALRAGRESALDVAIEALDSPRTRLLMIELTEWLATGAWLASDAAGGMLTELAESVLARNRAKVKKAGRALSGLDDQARHELRIAVKKLRYAVEFFAALFAGRRVGERAAFLAALESLQTDLGDLNDMATAGEVGRRLSRQWGVTLAEPAMAARKQARRRKTLLASAESAFGDLVSIRRFWK